VDGVGGENVDGVGSRDIDGVGSRDGRVWAGLPSEDDTGERVDVLLDFGDGGTNGDWRGGTGGSRVDGDAKDRVLREDDLELTCRMRRHGPACGCLLEG